MGRLKIKKVKLDWKGKLLKLRGIVLAGAPLYEADPLVIETFDLMRKIVRGEITEADNPVIPQFPESIKTWLWESFSDEKGENEKIFGWRLDATMYLASGKPWWLVRAQHHLDDPPNVEQLESAIDFFGADVKRDRIMNISFGHGHGYVMWWTWINQFPMLEIQCRKDPPDMRIVPEGSPLPPGYTRLDRNARH